MLKNTEINFMTMSINSPDILDKTYQYLSNNLEDIDLKKQTLYLNIDIFPNDINIKENEIVARKYFGNVIVNYEKDCNCTKAFMWCVKSMKTEYFFMIEANKCIDRKFKIENLINILKENESYWINLCSVNLSPQSNDYFLKYASSHPSIWINSKMQKIIELFTPYINYEYQLRELFLLMNYTSITLAKENNKYLLHIGKKWKSDKKFLLANSSSDNEIKEIVNINNWHKDIYRKFKIQYNIDKNILKKFKKKIEDKDWIYRWTGVWKYVDISKEKYYTRHLRKSSEYICNQ